MFLNNYVAMLILVTIFIMLLIVLIPDINTDKKKKTLFGIKIVWIIEAIVVIGFMVVGYFSYESSRAELKKSFLDNKTIVCNYKKGNIIIKKDNNYILKEGYFIKDNTAIDIDGCKSLEE